MEPIKKVGIPLAVLLIGSGILITTWWVNGAEKDDIWLYGLSLWFVMFAAYELYKGQKNKDR
jgi:hypothetical protein